VKPNWKNKKGGKKEIGRDGRKRKGGKGRGSIAG
jgi:hypothetical protein